MISIQVDPKLLKKVTKDLDKKVMGMKEINSAQSLTNISKAAFTITGKDFIKHINRFAKTSEGKKRLQHVYEWKGSGINTKRLFVLVRRYVQNGNLIVGTKFLQSKVPVPIKKELKKPGPTGKTVTAKNIFKNKAEVMESGKTVFIRSKKVIVFPNSAGELVFIKRGRQVTVRYPGGKHAKNGLTKYQQEWFRRNFAKSLEQSGLFKKIEVSAKRILNRQNSNPADIRKAVSEICEKYSKNMVIL